MKGVTNSDKPTENNPKPAGPISSAELFSFFQLIVLVLQPTTLLLIQSHSSH